jgi:hypothetical protein
MLYYVEQEGEITNFLLYLSLKAKFKQGMVVYTCNLSHLGGGGRKITNLRLA